MTIVEVAKGCMEGKWYRHYGMYKGYSIRRNTEHYTPQQFLGVYDETGHYSKPFYCSVAELIREDYIEVGADDE